MLGSKDQTPFVTKHYCTNVALTGLFPLLKFTLGTLVPYPKKIPTKAMPGTTAMSANGRILALSVLQQPLQLHQEGTTDSSYTVLTITVLSFSKLLSMCNRKQNYVEIHSEVK